MAIITVSSMIVSSTASLSAINIRFHEASVAFNRLYEFSKSKPEFEDGNQYSDLFNNWGNNFSLIVSNLSYRFAGRKRILNDVSIRVDKGELVTLYGEIGSGKSTLIHILQKHYLPEAGRILVNENSFDEIPIPVWRNMIGVVNQQSKIFNGTVGENICLDNFEKEKDLIIKFCIEYEFEVFLNTLPQGLYTLLGEDGINLSGGQQQLLLLMRSLYRKPYLLLLDEPTSSMDNKTEQFVLDILGKIKKNLAIILVTHRNQLMKHSDRSYFIENGIIYERVSS